MVSCNDSFCFDDVQLHVHVVTTIRHLRHSNLPQHKVEAVDI